MESKMKTGFFRWQGSLSKWSFENIRRESPYYNGGHFSKSKGQNLSKSNAQRGDTIKSGVFTLTSTDYYQLPKSNNENKGGTTTSQDTYFREKGPVLSGEVPLETEGENLLGEQSERIKAGFNKSDSSKSPISDIIPETSESHCSLTDSGMSSYSSALQRSPEYDSYSPMLDEGGSQSQSLDLSSDTDSLDETPNPRHEQNKRNPNGVTEKKSSTNNSIGLAGNKYSNHIKITRETGLSNISLPRCAALFYKQESLQWEDIKMCDNIRRLNEYLKDSKFDVDAGVPGRFLGIVIGKETPDLGSIVSAITYAYYLKATARFDQLCTVPVINMKRADLHLHTEVEWLFESCCIDQSSLIFIDEINLSYYKRFGSLKLILVNDHKLSSNQECYKDTVVEIFNCKQVESTYPWANTVNIDQVGSCCTLVAEKIALSMPTILAGHGLSRLLLAGILLDTANLTSPQCTAKDKCMATLLINGAGRFGCNGMFKLLKHKMFDISELRTRDVLRKDFKDWILRFGKHDVRRFIGKMARVGMSSIGMSLDELINREANAIEEIKHFQKTENLHLMVIVTGYYDSLRKFKRELVIAGENVDLINSLVHFFDSNSSRLELKPIYQSGFKDDIKTFNLENKIISRKSIEILLEEFFLL